MALERQPEWTTLVLVISTLNRISIPYMLTGSLAKTFYATPRMTRDIDIVIELLPSNIDKVVQAFEAAFYVDRLAVQEAVATQSMFNLIHNQFHVKVDFIVRKDEPFRIEEFSRKRRFEIQGMETWVVSPEDLILAKLVWSKDSHSEMQLGDIRDLLTSVKNLDRAYVVKWADLLGIRPLLEAAEK